MIEVKCIVEIEEINGNKTPPLRSDKPKIVIETHWNEDGSIILHFENANAETEETCSSILNEIETFERKLDETPQEDTINTTLLKERIKHANERLRTATENVARAKALGGRLPSVRLKLKASDLITAIENATRSNRWGT